MNPLSAPTGGGRMLRGHRLRHPQTERNFRRRANLAAAGGPVHPSRDQLHPRPGLLDRSIEPYGAHLNANTRLVGELRVVEFDHHARHRRLADADALC